VGCTADSCDELNDVVVHTPVHAACGSGLFCDGDAVCHPILDCQAGVPPVIDDGVSCTVDSCDEINDVVLNIPTDALCDNALFCDGEETCDAVNDCQPGTAPTVDDLVGCTVDSCDEVNDVVIHAPDHGSCDNGQFCDGVEVCDLVNDCSAGPALVIDDGVGCTTDFCDETNDLIVNLPVDANCDNTLFCDGTETCNSVTDCQPGAPPQLDDGVVCTDDSCDEVGDVVVHLPVHAACSNGLFCDGEEICDLVFDCIDGLPPAVNDAIGCTADSCDEVLDVIVHTPNDPFCDNGIFCDGAETCDVLLDCQAGVPPIVNDGVGCTDDVCDETNDVVLNTPNDALCDNTLFCDGLETCDPLLDCLPGPPPVVDDGIGCTNDSCDEAGDVIVNVPDDVNCDNGLFCDGPEFCDPELDCQDGPLPHDDGVGCTVDSCDELNDSILNVVDDASCDNGVLCSTDHCDPVLDCQHIPDHTQCTDTGNLCGGGLVCNPDFGCEVGSAINCHDNVDCTVDLCDPATGECNFVPNPAVCTDGFFCNGIEICDPFNGCEVGIPFDCSDGILCTFDSCDFTIDDCVSVPTDSACNNGLYCDGVETCDPLLDCMPDPVPVCDDNIDCTDDVCDEASFTCSAVANDLYCVNDFYCDGDETCSVLNGCQPGTDVDCTGSTVGCQTGFCNELTDSCATMPDDLACQNDALCDGIESCGATGVCDPGTPLDCTGLTSVCGTGFCDELSGGCEILVQADGTSCDDGDPCSTGDTCDGGICVGSGSMCGDGFIDGGCGEECDPPGGESCDAMEDLDSDNLFACEDPDCCDALVIDCGASCQNIAPCLRVAPAVGALRISSGVLDKLKIRGSIDLPDSSIVNPIEDGFIIGLTTDTGLIYKGTLLPGDLAERSRGPRRYKFKDKLAKVGQGVRDGILVAKIRVRDGDVPPTYSFKVKAVAELSAATNASIAIHVIGVEDAAVVRPNWRFTNFGWKLSKPASLEAVFPPASCSAVP
jgi:hypothetical protein